MNPVEYRDRRQQRIAESLDRIGPGIRAFFDDACRLMAAPDALECTSHFICHALREIESAVRDVVVPKEAAARAMSTKGSCGNHEALIMAALEEVGIAEDSPAGAFWLGLPKLDQGLYARAHRASLGPARPMDADVRDLWQGMQNLLETVLRAHEARYARYFGEVDALARQGPPTADRRGAVVKTIRSRIPHGFHVLRYLFEQLVDPGWLPVLREADLFEHPPSSYYDEQAQTHRFGIWPASEYLVRMAPHGPDAVADIAEGINTDNPAIVADLADVACLLPADRAARFVPKFARWQELPEWHALPQSLGRLVVHLAHGGDADGAFDLAHSLLRLVPDPPADQRSPVGLLAESRSPMPDYEYAQVLPSCLEALTDVDPDRTLTTVCGLLDEACRLGRISEEDDPADDLSWVRRPAIEDHEQNRVPWGLTGHLISAVRDVAEKVARAHPDRLRAVVEELRSRNRAVFSRIALHVVRLNAAADRALVAEALCDRELFFGSATWHEYAMLAREHFASLPKAQRDTILAWADAGPYRAHRRRRVQGEHGSPPSEEEERHLVGNWQLRRLAPFRHALPEDWQLRHDALVAEHGEPEGPDFLTWSSGIVQGPQSPVSAADLGTLSVPELIDYVRNWKPSGQLFGATPEGLGRSITELVATAPEAYADRADLFCEIGEPTYVSALLWGFNDALKKGQHFAWSGVLRLCTKAVERPRVIPGRDPNEWDRDPHWGWARQHVAALIGAGLQSGEAALPIEHREQVWNILRVLCEDPDPTPEHEAQYGGDNMDPITTSLNTVRGRTMHAVIQYALWVRRSTVTGSDTAQVRAQGDLPEVWELLEELLHPDREPSTTVRAVFGLFFSTLYALNREWVVGHLHSIFPEGPALGHLWDAAWLGYLAYTPAYGDLLDPMRSVYALAIERIGAPRAEGRTCETDERLGEHLMGFYWLGLLPLDEPAGLLVRFFESATVALRATTVGYVGRTLCPSGAKFTGSQLDRLRRFFDWRLASVQDTGGDGPAQELAGFGWWFASGWLGEEWSLGMLAVVLRLAETIDPYLTVLERLADRAPSWPRQCIECLALMLDSNSAREFWWGGEHEMRAIISAAVGSDDASARETARALINRLAARGQIGYRDLIPA